MRAILAALLACLGAALHVPAAALAEDPRPLVEDLTLRLLPLDQGMHGADNGDAALTLGTLAATPRQAREHVVVVRRRVALRLDSPSGRVTTARLQAQLAAETPGCTLRVDGVTLSALPRLVDAVHRVGVPVVHEIELSITAGAPEGALLAEVEWLAESD